MDYGWPAMYITSLTPKGKTRTGVTFDEDVTLIVSNTDLAAYDFREGAEIAPKIYEELWQGVRQEAMHRSAALLQGMDYTSQGLRAKLLRSGFPDEIVQEAAAAAEKAGLIDDLRYACHYLQYHMTDRSRTRIRADLLAKGVADSLIDEAFRMWEEDAAAGACRGEGMAQSPAEAAELDQIRRILRKRHYNPQDTSRDDEQKLVAYLQYKGYPLSTIRHAIRSETEGWN